jgi:hypothetical protein
VSLFTDCTTTGSVARHGFTFTWGRISSARFKGRPAGVAGDVPVEFSGEVPGEAADDDGGTAAAGEGAVVEPIVCPGASSGSLTSSAPTVGARPSGTVTLQAVATSTRAAEHGSGKKWQDSHKGPSRAEIPHSVAG